MSVEKPDIVASLRSYYERRRRAEFEALTDCGHKPWNMGMCRLCSKLRDDPVHDMGPNRRLISIPMSEVGSIGPRHEFTPIEKGVGDPRTCPYCWEMFHGNSAIIDENMIVADLKLALRELGHVVVEIDTVKRALARLEEGAHGD